MTAPKKMRSLEQQIGVDCRSSDIVGAVQRQVIDAPGILAIEVVRVLADRFPPAAIVRTIAKMCDRKAKMLDRSEGRLNIWDGIDRDSNETSARARRAA